MSDLFFLNSIYMKPVFERDISSGKSVKTVDDAIIINIKNVKTKESSIQIIERPTIDFYYKENNDLKYQEDAVKEDKVRKITCKFTDRSITLAKTVGKLNEFFEACRQGWQAKSAFEQYYLYNNPDLYMADINIEDYYKNVFLDKHGRKNFVDNADCLNLGFADIEVDQYGYKGPKATGQNPVVPVNLITYFDTVEYTLHAFILHDKSIPEIDEVKNDLKSYVTENILPLIPEEHRDKIKYSFKFYNTEAEVIIAFFKKTHENKPDFIGWWNINFDIPYLIGRMEILGLDPNEIICHPDIPKKYRKIRYIEDPDRKRDLTKGPNNTHPSRFWDWLVAPGYTQHYDMMSLYSNLRKRYILPSYSLDSIGEAETGHRKVDYRSMGKGYTIRNLAHKNFKLFLAYGCIDTFLLYLIELSSEDMMKYIIFTDNTRLQKGINISYVIYCQLYRWFKDSNRVIGNSVKFKIHESIRTKDDDEGIDGAIVASPDLIRNQKVLVFKHVVDYDEASLYPNLIIEFNIDKTTIRGRIYKIYNAVTGEVIPIDSLEFNTKLQTLELSIFDLCNEFFGLPNLDEIMLEIEQMTDIRIKNKNGQ